MQNTILNTISLLEITDDAEFITQCYHIMLGRSLNPFEMQHAVEMLSKGLSRKGFIYYPLPRIWKSFFYRRNCFL